MFSGDCSNGGGKTAGDVRVGSKEMLTLQWLGIGTLLMNRNPTGSCSMLVPKNKNNMYIVLLKNI